MLEKCPARFMSPLFHLELSSLLLKKSVPLLTNYIFHSLFTHGNRGRSTHRLQPAAPRVAGQGRTQHKLNSKGGLTTHSRRPHTVDTAGRRRKRRRLGGHGRGRGKLAGTLNAGHGTRTQPGRWGLGKRRALESSCILYIAVEISVCVMRLCLEMHGEREAEEGDVECGMMERKWKKEKTGGWKEKEKRVQDKEGGMRWRKKIRRSREER